MNRRAFITLLGSAAAWPLTARGQRALPTIGLLSSVPFNTRRDQLDGFRQGLAESGFVEGQSVRIETYKPRYGRPADCGTSRAD
jgi:putative ABC transport system substrate-binding protein